MSRDYRVYLEDILDAIGHVGWYTHNVSFEVFIQDQMRFDAVVRNLEIIGEAARQVPESIRTRSPAIEWRKIAGLRDILIHHYFDINKKIVWDVVTSKLPILREQVRTLLRENTS